MSPNTAHAETSREPLTSWSAASPPGSSIRFCSAYTGSGKTFTMAKVIEQSNRPALILAHNKTLAAQLYHEFKQFFPRQRGRILCQLLRLLPARSLHSRRRPLYREGSHDQRRTRQAAPLGHALALRAPRHDHRQLGELHLRPRLARCLFWNAAAARKGPEDQPQRHHAPPSRNSLRAQRHGPSGAEHSAFAAT